MAVSGQQPLEIDQRSPADLRFGADDDKSLGDYQTEKNSNLEVGKKDFHFSHEYRTSAEAMGLRPATRRAG